MPEAPAPASAPGPAAPHAAGGPVVGSAVDSAGNLVKRGELLDSILHRRLVVVTGTGVSLQTVGHPGADTDVASWPGLLTHGLGYCLARDLISKPAAAIVEAQVAEGSAGSLIEAAQKIHDCLDQRVDARRFWMRETIGQLKVKDAGLITAIRDLGGLIATLNYDQLTEDVTGLTFLQWRQQAEITRRVRNREKDFVLHIHGRWDDPGSIVLDRKSYEEIVKNSQMRELLGQFARFETLLFVGCGQTFFDPNFQSLLDWAHGALSGFEHRHFVLCRQSEEPGFYEKLKPHGHLEPLVYGQAHADLLPFLAKLASEGSAGPAAAPAVPTGPKLLTPAEVWKRQSRL
ncbi:MAG: SIR2 family protein [Opitutaceae bacterium]|nr:SIR2 family protein [Opitutaceae bacterium]